MFTQLYVLGEREILPCPENKTALVATHLNIAIQIERKRILYTLQTKSLIQSSEINQPGTNKLQQVGWVDCALQKTSAVLVYQKT
jgi:hypothetical protein